MDDDFRRTRAGDPKPKPAPVPATAPERVRVLFVTQRARVLFARKQ